MYCNDPHNHNHDRTLLWHFLHSICHKQKVVTSTSLSVVWRRTCYQDPHNHSNDRMHPHPPLHPLPPAQIRLRTCTSFPPITDKWMPSPVRGQSDMHEGLPTDSVGTDSWAHYLQVEGSWTVVVERPTHTQLPHAENSKLKSYSWHKALRGRGHKGTVPRVRQCVRRFPKMANKINK